MKGYITRFFKHRGTIAVLATTLGFGGTEALSSLRNEYQHYRSIGEAMLQCKAFLDEKIQRQSNKGETL